MQDKISINFGPDKSQILRGLAIIFMICLHNKTIGEFKICVPIFTFLVGYGYAFAKERNLKHAFKRSWHLLSHFWLILLGICFPVAVLAGGFQPTLSDVLPEMFGLNSQLNWYSWYVYFYIFAMIAMIPFSRLITRFGLVGTGGLILFCFAGTGLIHLIPNWNGNMWTQALFDCLLCSPTMLTGYWAAENKIVGKIQVNRSFASAIILIALMVLIFFLRGLSYLSYLDFITVPIFCIAFVALFNIITWEPSHRFFIALGKESMNMWFFHALFATTCTAAVFAPLIDWIHPKILLIAAMITVSYLAGKLLTGIYAKLR